MLQRHRGGTVTRLLPPIVALLLFTAPSAAQSILPDTTGIYSDRQLRQRIGFQLSQLRNIITAAEAAKAHAEVTLDHVHRKIVRDSLRAVAPQPADSLTLYYEDVPYVHAPESVVLVGQTVRLCAVTWVGTTPRLPMGQVAWQVADPDAVRVSPVAGTNCADFTALRVAWIDAGSPAAYRIAMNSIRRRR
jgi:hypothetical protein